MIDFYINGQSLTFFSPVVAADSLNCLESQFHFSPDWEGFSRWAHFRQGETVYDLQLDENDRIAPERGLNLHLGYWQINVTGLADSRRMTTESVILQVKKSGLVDAPLHELPQSVAEQISLKADSALQMASELKAAAERGDFMGQSFQVLGYFETLSGLEAAITEPDKGSVYGVGTAAPYDIYIWDTVNGRWHNNGPIQGARGEAGACFIPTVDAAGNLSWTNTANLPDPETVNLMGPKGDRGEKGADGQSPYEAAVAEGFTGTATTFNAALVTMPQHAARHGEGAVDALPAGSISGSMLKAGAVSLSFTLSLTAEGWSGERQSVSAAVNAGDTLIVTPAPESLQDYAGCGVYCLSQQEGALSFACADVPEMALTVNVTKIRG